MPQLIPIVAAVATAAVGAAGTAGLITATTVALATLAITVVATAATFVMQRRARNRITQANDNSNASGQVTLRQADAARRVIVGTARVAANATPVYDTDDSNRFHRLLVMGHGRTAGFQEFQLNGEPITLTGAGLVTGSADGKWDGNVRILTKNGDDDQSAISQLLSEYSPWTSAHRCRGLSLAYIRQEPVAFDDPNQSENNRELELHAIMRGSDQVYDPRDSSTGWTENAALILRWYWMHPDGFNIPASRIDDDAFAVAADVCDVLIPLAAGGSEKQFRCAGTFTLAEDRNTVSDAMLENMDAHLTMSATGKMGVRIGNAAVSNLLTFSEENVLVERFQTGKILKDFRNSVQALIASEDHNFQNITVPPQEDAASIAEIGRRTFSYNLRFCPSGTQAQRLARRKLFRLNAQDVGEIITDLSGMNARPGDTISLGYANATTSLPLKVASREYSARDQTVRLQVQTIDPLETFWDTSLEQAVQENPPQSINGRLLGVPAGVALAGQLQIVNNTSVALLAAVSWTSLNDSTVLAEVEIAETPSGGADPIWFGRTTVSSSQGRVLISGVSDNVQYSARVRFQGAGGQFTDFTEITGVDITLDDAQLPAPTVTVSAGTVQEFVDVTISVTAFDTYLVDQVRIFEDGVQIHTASVTPGGTVDFTKQYGSADTGQTFEITAAIVNDSAVQGLISAPVTIAVTAAP